MDCELLATCSALGYLEGDVYHKESDCLESIKDLIRYLRHEDDTRDVRQQLGESQIIQNDLLPIIVQHGQDKALYDACIRLMVNLTQPAMLCFGKVPDDPVFRHHYMQVTCHLQAYKESFASEKVFGVLSETLYNLLQLDWEQRQEEDNLLIERILMLVRNVLHVPADPNEEKKVDDDASIHDRVLWALHMSGFDDLVKFLASAQSEQQWSMHVLEIISLMFRDQTPEALVSAGQARSAEEKQRDSSELEALRQREQAAKRSRTLQRGTRHSRFGGSFVIQGLKSSETKIGASRPKRHRQAQECNDKRRSALNVRLFLREFCVDFLETATTASYFIYIIILLCLFSVVQENLIREQTEQHDETYYLWALSFFMAFNRGNGFRADFVSETMSIRAFHFIERNITNYYEMMLTDRKEAVSWSRRMHLALKAYQELLLTINEMDQSKDESIRQSSNVIKSNIFYMMEYREIFVTLLRKFDETKQPRSYLKDLVETTHLFLRMLERFCKGRKNLMVQKKRVKRRKSKGGKKSSVSEQTPEALSETWKIVEEELRASEFKLSASLTESVVPFDATSETPLEEQRSEVMIRVQDALLNRLGPEALGLLRAGVWPDGDVFGSSDVQPEEELELLKQILHANLPRAGDFAKYVIRGFFKVAAQNDKAYVELLFWKNVGAVREMTEGYTKDGGGKRVAWTEEEEEELRRLYEEHRDSDVPDIIEHILPLLSNCNRHRRQVVVQLVHMGLVDSAKELKKPKKGTGIVLWTEEQEEELQMLFEEFKESDDVLGDIMKKITAKRSRARVVDKLLSLGLVSDRRELHKKRSRGAGPSASRAKSSGRNSGKSSGRGMTEEEFLSQLTGDFPEPDEEDLNGDEEQSSEDEEEDEDQEEEERGRHMEDSQNGGLMNSLNFTTSSKRVDVSAVTRTLRQEGLSGPILWLQNCLNKTANYREEDGTSQPVPIVPLTEENEDAMENKNFQKLLKNGSSVPQSVRGPSRWSRGRSRPSSDSRDQAPDQDPDQDSGTSSEQRTQALRALLLERKRKHQSSDDAAPVSNPSPLEEQNGSPEKPVVKTSAKRRRVLDDDDDDEDKENEADSPTPMVLDTSRDLDSDGEDLSAPLKRRRKLVIDDDDDEE
ncbi:hypothetical protein WMY93_011133 [Mugilogobius chulae]|uniref:Timeless circadian clock n=1 Tax=Mugilogobius chulae TaxID=88201 RepID=A0AAW0P135_9GOBI